jgi:hypothetical protein
MPPSSQIKTRLQWEWNQFLHRNPALDIPLHVKMIATMGMRRCSLGPFDGELGHLLGHVLPFATYLKSRHVDVSFCGLKIYEPFFKDSSGASLVSHYTPLRESFNSSQPSSQSQTAAPPDVTAVKNDFIRRSSRSFAPFWNLTDVNYYFYRSRWWILKKGYMKSTDLTPVYGTTPENACVIFTRRKASNRMNHGDDWNYNDVIDRLASHFSTIYVAGHPDLSQSVSQRPNVKSCVTADNQTILRACCNSRLIVTPHSGAVYLGPYSNTPVMIIYQRDGSRDIANFEPTLKTYRALGATQPMFVATSLDEVSNLASQVNAATDPPPPQPTPGNLP